MRPFEIAFLLFEALLLAALSFRAARGPHGLRVLLLVPALLAGSQVWVEGYRWQMIPGYVLAGGLLLLAAMSLAGSLTVSRSAVWLGWMLLAGAFTAGMAFPMFSLPKPTGPYSVGTEIRHLTDHGHIETLGGGPHRPREIMIQIWYPAKVSPGGRPVRYVPDRRLIRAFIDSHLTSIATHSFLNAPADFGAAPFPVVIFSPSWQGQRYQNTFQVEELASHGFVVVGIDHTYSTAVTLFPDGRIARAPNRPFEDVSSQQAFERSIRYDEKLMRVRVQDIRFVADELQREQKYSPSDGLVEHLDLGRLGVLGFSFGGGAAAQTCWEDKRFLAGVNMGGTMFGEVAEQGVSQPFLFLDEGGDIPAEDLHSTNEATRRYAEFEMRDVVQERKSLEAHGGYRVRIHGAGHHNFTDYALFSPIRRITDAGDIDPLRGMKIINAYTLAFFDKYLKQKKAPLLEEPSPYPEAQFEHALPPEPLAAGETPEKSVNRVPKTANREGTTGGNSARAPGL